MNVSVNLTPGRWGPRTGAVDLRGHKTRTRELRCLSSQSTLRRSTEVENLSNTVANYELLVFDRGCAIPENRSICVIPQSIQQNVAKQNLKVHYTSKVENKMMPQRAPLTCIGKRICPKYLNNNVQ